MNIKRQVLSGLKITYRVMIVLFIIGSLLSSLTPVRVDIPQMAKDITSDIANRINHYDNKPTMVSTDITKYLMFNEIRAATSRYWVGGAGSWTQTVHWSDSDGGLGGFSVPTTADNVSFTTNSDNGTGSYTVTQNGNPANCHDFEAVNPSGGVLTFGGSSSYSLGIGGSFSLGTGVLWTTASGITFSSTVAETITTNGVIINSAANPTMTFSGVGGSWQLQDSLTRSGGGGITVTTGTLDTNGQTVNIVGSSSGTFSIGAAGIVTLGASSISSYSWTCNAAGTVTAGTSTITTSYGGAIQFQGGGKTYYNVVITNAGASDVLAFTGANTFTNLTITGGNSAAYQTVTLPDTQTVSGTLTLTGYSSSKKLKVFSSALHTQRTLSAGTVTVSNVIFRDIIGAGAGNWNLSARTDIGNAYGNSGITFPAATTVYASQIPGNVNWTDTNNWASASGGVPGTGRVPLPQDTAIFDQQSMAINGIIITFDDYTTVSSINTTMVTKNPQFGATNVYIYGSLNLGTCLWAVTGTTYLMGQKAMTLSGDFSDGAGGLYLDPQTGSFAQDGDITVDGTITLYSGVWETNDYDVTCQIFNSATTTYSRALWMDSSRFTLTSTATATKWNVAALNLNIDSITSTIVFTSTGTNTGTFTGAGKTYYNLEVRGAGAYTFNFGDANTFNDITVVRSNDDETATANKTISGSFTETINHLYCKTYDSANLTITNTDFTKTSGLVYIQYARISGSAAGGGANFLAGSAPPSYNGTGNSGWQFIDAISPSVSAQAATNVDRTTAVVNGSVDSLGSYTSEGVYVHFEYGETAVYGSNTTEIFYNSTGVKSAGVTGLSFDTTYHFRIALRYNGTDYVYGADTTFLTLGSPTVLTENPTNVNLTNATLNGFLSSLGDYVTVFGSFDYGQSASPYSSVTAETALTAPGAFSANLTALAPNTTYHVRAKVRYNATQYAYGNDLTFVTTIAGSSNTTSVHNWAAVVRDYMTTGDMLVVAEISTTYSSYFPTANPAQYFQMQLISTDNTTILGASPLVQWGDRPESIYFNPTVAATLTDQAAYIVKLASLSPDITVNTTYTLVPTDWKGNNLEYLDSWCIGTAINMEATDGTILSRPYIQAVTDFDVVITDAAGGFFTKGIPAIAQVRPNLFNTAEHKNVVPTLSSAINYNSGTTLQGKVGTQISNDANTVGGIFSLSGQRMLLFLIIGVLMLCVIYTVSSTQGWGALGAVCIAAPIIGASAYFNIMNIAIPTIAIVIAAIMFGRQIWLKTT